ncbi:MAG TPA: hypothetical protein VFT22_44935 [Kofleriaceae bacterium]|nr:hypothetical protein [Kofleriaceae bacterium]
MLTLDPIPYAATRLSLDSRALPAAATTQRSVDPSALAQIMTTWRCPDPSALAQTTAIFRRSCDPCAPAATFRRSCDSLLHATEAADVGEPAIATRTRAETGAAALGARGCLVLPA